MRKILALAAIVTFLGCAAAQAKTAKSTSEECFDTPCTSDDFETCHIASWALKVNQHDQPVTIDSLDVGRWLNHAICDKRRHTVRWHFN